MNTKQIPFRYPEDLEKDFKTISNEISTWSSKKNQALQKAVMRSARLFKLAEKFKDPQARYFSGVNAEQLLNKLEKITKGLKDVDINKLEIKTDIKKNGQRK